MTPNAMLASAIALAAHKHQNQMRKEGTPYIYHPLHVAHMVAEAGYDIHYQVVALLHDVLEDTDTTADELSLFGEDIVQAVILLTRKEGADEAAYVEAILQNPMAKVVKNADKMHNLGNCTNCTDAAWVRRYIEKAKTYYLGKFSKELDAIIEDADKRTP